MALTKNLLLLLIFLLGTCLSLNTYAGPVCGDDNVDPGETCDPPGAACGGFDGNVGTEVCREVSCTCCGDGVEDTGDGEECDDANTNPNDACDTQGVNVTGNGACTATFCGDSTLQTPNGDGVTELCDDGNTTSGDGCDANCQLESTTTTTTGGTTTTTTGGTTTTTTGGTTTTTAGTTTTTAGTTTTTAAGTTSSTTEPTTTTTMIAPPTTTTTITPPTTTTTTTTTAPPTTTTTTIPPVIPPDDCPDGSIEAGDSCVELTASGGESLSNISTADMEDLENGVRFPFGSISYTTTSPLGGSVTVRMTFSSDLPNNLSLWKVDNEGVSRELPTSIWRQVDSRSVDVTLTDGDRLTDLDRTVNGSIDDPVAVGATSGGGGGGGCTISKTETVDPIWLFLLAAPGIGYLRRRGYLTSSRKALEDLPR